MTIQISNTSAEVFIRRHGPLPVSDRAGWVEKMDESALGCSNLLDRAEVFYVLGQWRSRQEFNQLLEEQRGPDEHAMVVLPGGKCYFADGDSDFPRTQELTKSQPPRQDVIMASGINFQKLRAFIAQNGPILASDKVGWVHKIDQDFPDGFLLLDRAREFFVFPTWLSRQEFLKRLETDVPDLPAAIPDPPARST